MTIYTDSATISTKTTPSATDIADRIDQTTINGTTTLIYVEGGPYYEPTTTISTATTIITGEIYTVHIVTRDYNDVVLTQDVSTDTTQPVAGTAGTFDNDNGELV